jgi:hypothetical protein
VDQPQTIAILAGLDLVVLSIITTIYYYESIRGDLQGRAALHRKAEHMFGLASGLCALSSAGIALLLWWSTQSWVVVLNKVIITFDMVVIAYGCVRWMMGCWVNQGWYFIPWKSSADPAQHIASSKAPRPER